MLAGRRFASEADGPKAPTVRKVAGLSESVWQKTCVVDSMIDEFCAEAPDLEGFLFIEEGRSLYGSLSSMPFKVESLASSSSCRFPFSFPTSQRTW